MRAPAAAVAASLACAVGAVRSLTGAPELLRATSLSSDFPTEVTEGDDSGIIADRWQGLVEHDDVGAWLKQASGVSEHEVTWLTQASNGSEDAIDTAWLQSLGHDWEPPDDPVSEAPRPAPKAALLPEVVSPVLMSDGPYLKLRSRLWSELSELGTEVLRELSLEYFPGQAAPRSKPGDLINHIVNDASVLPLARAEEMSRLGGEELVGELCQWLGRHLQNAPWLAELKAKTVRELYDIGGYIGLPCTAANSKAPLIDKIMRRVSMNDAAMQRLLHYLGRQAPPKEAPPSYARRFDACSHVVRLHVILREVERHSACSSPGAVPSQRCQARAQVQHRLAHRLHGGVGATTPWLFRVKTVFGVALRKRTSGVRFTSCEEVAGILVDRLSVRTVAMISSAAPNDIISYIDAIAGLYQTLWGKIQSEFAAMDRRTLREISKALFPHFSRDMTTKSLVDRLSHPVRELPFLKARAMLRLASGPKLIDDFVRFLARRPQRPPWASPVVFADMPKLRSVARLLGVTITTSLLDCRPKLVSAILKAVGDDEEKRSALLTALAPQQTLEPWMSAA